MQSKGNKLQQFSSAIAGALLAGSALVLATTTAYAASPSMPVYQGQAFGAQVEVGSAVKLGPIAIAYLPSCSPVTGTSTASVTSASLPGLVSTGVVQSVTTATLDNTTSSSDVLGINLLNGVIKATEIKAVSTSSESGSEFTTNSEGSVVTGLTVLGLPVSANVAPNTVIKLPFIGSVTLNEQTPFANGDMASLTVNMIHVRITLGTNAGTDIIVSSAWSEIRSVGSVAVVGGSAFSPRLVAGPVTSGPLVTEVVPCTGTGGVVETDAVAAANLPGVVTTGEVSVTAEANVTHTEAQVQTTSSVADVNLLGGLVTVTAINGVANGVTTNGKSFTFAGGSTLVGLAVEGFPAITDNPPANTKIVIANLGTLYLNRVEPAADNIRIVPIELVVGSTNKYGLAVGADLTIGAAEAALHNATIP